MFAVKGWSVDPASLKPQTQLFKSSNKDDGEAEKSSKKRKRGNGGGSTNDGQSEDVSRLWERHVEGKVPSKKKKEPKRQKLERSDSGDATVEAASKVSRPVAERVGGTSIVNAEPGAEDRKEQMKKKSKSKHANTEHTQKPVRESGNEARSTEKDTTPAIHPAPPAPAKLTSMQSAMRQKLISARFRHLNETLYTKPSYAALKLFDENPEMFGDYHAGFRQQVSVWPENPIDRFIAEIRSRGKIRQPKKEDKGTKRHWKAISEGKQIEALPRTHGTAIIADLGCGDARLAQTLKDSGDMTRMNLKLHSFDLHSPSPLVTKADISKLPLEDGSADIAIFCLALMGTNWIAFVEEAYRILHWKGELWVAEIKSRFGRVGKSKGKVVEHSVGSKRKREALKALKEAKKRSEDDRDEQDVLRTEVDEVPTVAEETDVSAFVDVLKRRGFVLKTAKGADLSNKMFVKMEFVKALTPTKGKRVPDETKPGMKKAKTKFIPELEDEVLTDDEAATLKPCLYKIR